MYKQEIPKERPKDVEHLCNRCFNWVDTTITIEHIDIETSKSRKIIGKDLMEGTFCIECFNLLISHEIKAIDYESSRSNTIQKKV